MSSDVYFVAKRKMIDCPYRDGLGNCSARGYRPEIRMVSSAQGSAGPTPLRKCPHMSVRGLCEVDIYYPSSWEGQENYGRFR